MRTLHDNTMIDIVGGKAATDPMNGKGGLLGLVRSALGLYVSAVRSIFRLIFGGGGTRDPGPVIVGPPK